MVLLGWQHISQTQGVLLHLLLLLLLMLLLLLLQLLLSALVEESELLLEDVAADAATLCEHLRLVLREDLQSCLCLGAADAASFSEDLHLVLTEDMQPCACLVAAGAATLVFDETLMSCPVAVDGSEQRIDNVRGPIRKESLSCRMAPNQKRIGMWLVVAWEETGDAEKRLWQHQLSMLTTTNDSDTRHTLHHDTTGTHDNMTTQDSARDAYPRTCNDGFHFCGQ